jgi:transcriptional regulator with XRE-family HTH domain
MVLPENVAIGQKIRKRRGDFGLSLRALAKKTNLTASFLSQIERGVIAPSLNSLRKIAEALDVPLLFFLSDTSKRSPLVRANARPHIDLEHSSVSYELLTPDTSRKLEVVCGTLEACTGNVVRPLSVPTEEFIMVLSGSLQVGIDEETYVLNTGDSIYFDGPSLKELSCVSDEKVTWISVITPPVF